ncbi:MAG: fumarylacetoacetate hydrolase family protein [Coxiellaceae bacterium]|nr:fumarylacetoacetate hydrolase family protein [Coxiellaceae bacterium]
MKLATLKTKSRDGQLIIVSHDNQMAVSAHDIALTMQQALDNWQESEPLLVKKYAALNNGDCDDAFAFDQTQCHSPLPRAYQWADGSAYVNHVELVRKARGAEMPENFWHDPLMYQGGSDNFIAPNDPIQIADTAWGIDFEAEIAVITRDVPMGVSAEDADDYISLVMLVNDVSLRGLIPNELSKGFGFFQSKPSSAFSPLAVTANELGSAWKDSKLHLPLCSTLNGELFGQPNAGVDMTFNFAQLIAHAAKSRPLCAGTIIGSGTISNTDRSSGSSCLAEKRTLEKIADGEPKTPFMQFGDSIRIEMFDADGKSIFGTIDQTVEQYVPAKAKASV